MKKALSMTVVFALAASTAFGAPQTKAAPQPIEALKKLTGTWEGSSPDGKPMRISFKPVSEGTAIMETHDGGGHSDSMITIYHMDGSDLVLTHFCSMGNAPRMRAKVTPGAKDIVFSYIDATNVENQDSPHMHKLVFRFDDADHVTQEWTMKDGAKETTLALHFARKKA